MDPSSEQGTLYCLLVSPAVTSITADVSFPSSLEGFQFMSIWGCLSFTPLFEKLYVGPGLVISDLP